MHEMVTENGYMHALYTYKDENGQSRQCTICVPVVNELRKLPGMTMVGIRADCAKSSNF